MNLRFAAFAVVTLAVAGCASRPVSFYTLGAPAVERVLPPADNATPTVSVGRVTLPDYLDTQDMMLRDGNRIVRSQNGRWASRLSQGATDLLAAKLGQAWPHTFVTSQPQSGTAETRLSITISRLDITRDGHGALDADWTITPSDEHRPVLRGRAGFNAAGNVATDSDNATLTENLLDQLASRIASTQNPG